MGDFIDNVPGGEFVAAALWIAAMRCVLAVDTCPIARAYVASKGFSCLNVWPHTLSLWDSILDLGIAIKRRLIMQLEVPLEPLFTSMCHHHARLNFMCPGKYIIRSCPLSVFFATLYPSTDGNF